MSKLSDQLREHKIFNTWELLKAFGDKGKDISVQYYSAVPRSVRCASTQVWSPSFNTDPDTAWYDYQKKTFSGTRKESFEEAKKWASAEYGIEEWVPCPMIRGTHVPKYVVDRAKAFLKKQI